MYSIPFETICFKLKIKRAARFEDAALFLFLVETMAIGRFTDVCIKRAVGCNTVVCSGFVSPCSCWTLFGERRRHRRLARRYWIEEEIWKVTINYLDDGDNITSMESERKLRDHNHNFYWWFDHVDGSGSQCGG